jgi:hypothetical protein
MMGGFDEIRWNVFLSAGNRRNAETLLKRIAKALGEKISGVDIVPDREAPTLFKATFTSPLEIARVEDAAFESLRKAGALSHHWEVRTPQGYEGGRWDFAGWSNRKLRISGIVAAEFEIANF